MSASAAKEGKSVSTATASPASELSLEARPPVSSEKATRTVSSTTNSTSVSQVPMRSEIRADNALRSSDPSSTRGLHLDTAAPAVKKSSATQSKPASGEPKVQATGSATTATKSGKQLASSNPHGTNLRRWFRQLSVEERRRVVSIMDEEMTELVLLMSLKLKKEGPGFFAEVGQTDEADLFASPTEGVRNRSNSLSNLPPYSNSPSNMNSRQGRSLFRNGTSSGSSSSRRSATSAGVGSHNTGSLSNSRSRSQTREPILRFRQPLRGGVSSSSSNSSSSSMHTRGRAASKGAVPSSSHPLSSSTGAPSSKSNSKLSSSLSASSLSPSSSFTSLSRSQVSSSSLNSSTSSQNTATSVADVLHRIGDECAKNNSMNYVADAMHRLGDQLAKKGGASASTSQPNISSSTGKSGASTKGASSSSSSSSSPAASSHVRSNSATGGAGTSTLSSSANVATSASSSSSRARPFPNRYFDDFFASDLIALNPYTPNEENFVFRRHCSIINTDSFTSTTIRLEEELMDAVRLCDAKQYLDTITLSGELLRSPKYFFNVMRVASRGEFLKKPCAMSWQAKDKSWLVESPEWFEAMGYYTFSTFIASQVEMRLWQAYYHHANIDPRRESGHFGSGSSKASAKVTSSRHQDTLVSKSHLVEFWTKLSLAQKTDLIRSMGNMIEAKVKVDFAELSYPQLLNFLLKLTSVSRNVSNADNPLLQPNNEREFIDFIFLSPLRRAGTGVDLVLRRLGVFIETAYVDQQRADLILGEKMEKEKALSKAKHNKRKSKTVHSHTVPSSSDSYATKHNTHDPLPSSSSSTSSSKLQSDETSLKTAKSAPVSPVKPSNTSLTTPSSPNISLATISGAKSADSSASAAAVSPSSESSSSTSSVPAASATSTTTTATTSNLAAPKPEPLESTMSAKELTAAGFMYAGRRKGVFTRAKDDSAAPNQKKQPHVDHSKAHRRSKDDTHSGTWTGPSRSPTPNSSANTGSNSSSSQLSSQPSSLAHQKAAPGSPKSKRSSNSEALTSSVASKSAVITQPHSSTSVIASATTSNPSNSPAGQLLLASPKIATKATDVQERGPTLSPSSSSSSNTTNASTASTSTPFSSGTAVSATSIAKPSNSGYSAPQASDSATSTGASTNSASGESSGIALRVSSESLPAPSLPQIEASKAEPVLRSRPTSSPPAPIRPLGLAEAGLSSASESIASPSTASISTSDGGGDEDLDLEYPPGLVLLDLSSLGTADSSAPPSGSHSPSRSLRSSTSSISSETCMSASSAPSLSTPSNAAQAPHSHAQRLQHVSPYHPTSGIRGKGHFHGSAAFRNSEATGGARQSGHSSAHQPAQHHNSSHSNQVGSHHHSHGGRHDETMSDRPSSRKHQQEQLDSLKDRPHPTQKTRTSPSLFSSDPSSSKSATASSTTLSKDVEKISSSANSSSTVAASTSRPVDTPSIRASLNANASPYYPAPSTFSPPRSAQMHSSLMRQSTPPGRLQGTDSWVVPYIGAAPAPFQQQWMQYPIEFGPSSALGGRARSVDEITASYTPTSTSAHSGPISGHDSRNSNERSSTGGGSSRSKGGKRSGNKDNQRDREAHHHQHHHPHQHQQHDGLRPANMANSHSATMNAPGAGTMSPAAQSALLALPNHTLAYTGLVPATTAAPNYMNVHNPPIIIALPAEVVPQGAVIQNAANNVAMSSQGAQPTTVFAATVPPQQPEPYRIELPHRAANSHKKLTTDINEFVARVDAITGPRTVDVLRIVGYVQKVVDTCFPGQGMIAEMYGSFSTRLGIPASDLDLVITRQDHLKSPSKSSSKSPTSTPSTSSEARGGSPATDQKITGSPASSPILSSSSSSSSNVLHSPLSTTSSRSDTSGSRAESNSSKNRTDLTVRQAAQTIGQLTLARTESGNHVSEVPQQAHLVHAVMTQSPREILVEQLTTLYSALTKEPWLRPEKMQLIDTASVPVIKLTCLDTELPVDITMEDPFQHTVHTGLQTRSLTRSFGAKWPEFRPLVLVIKQMIHDCNLHHIYTGGISSYFLTILIVSYLQIYGHTAKSLGGHLLNFLDLYGNKFNFQAILIRISDPPDHTLLPVSHYTMHAPPIDPTTLMGPPPSLPALNIVDPLDTNQNVGQSVFGMPDVQLAFHSAFLALRNHYDSDRAPNIKLEDLFASIRNNPVP